MSSRGLEWKFWFCNNPDCPALGDDTPTSDPNSQNCLMCNKPHIWVELESAVNHRDIRTIVRAAVLS
jgi:hypothetical protein